ncbi:MAG: FkbM family methyltransferase [Halioglobus sp.]|nr:FkbM family methyltransferase [Halioglobus sp.]
MNTAESVALRVPGLSRRLRLAVHDARDRVISRRIRREGIWEPYETSLLRAFLKPGDVFVDVGANVGYFAVIAAERVGARGRVFAFEPDPDNYRLLCHNARLNGFERRIEAVCAGLSDRAGEGALYLSEDNLGDHRIFAGGDGRHWVPVRLYRGADFLASRPRHLDLVKIDTQGAEYRVINGLLPLFSKMPQPPRILVELTPFDLRRAGSSGRELIALLARLGQPMWIVDHVEHRLAPSTAADLALWCDNIDDCAGDRGFMNILVGPGLDAAGGESATGAANAGMIAPHNCDQSFS